MAREWTLVCGVVAFTLAISASAAAPSRYDVDGCQPDKLTVYKVVLHTYWTRDKFPKHYPDWKPPAQWSKIYGLTHDARYVLFRLGQRVSSGVRAFAETGLADSLGAGGAGLGGALDEFSAPPIIQGAGRTEATFFVDGNHSRVSLMSRMMPSPDWFIGVDSFDLCVDGNWLDSITIEADPIDAGTDNGFTFTAPDWATAPQGVAYRITSRYPAHPAGSFFYPHLRRLPPIATFQFIKLREYEVSEVFSRDEDDRRYDVLQLQNLAHNSIDVLDGNHALSVAEDAERAQSVPEPRYEAAQAPHRAHLMSILGVLDAAGEDRATPDNAYQFDMSNSANSTLWKSRSGVLSTMSSMITTSSTPQPQPQPRSDNEVAAEDTRAILHGIARRYRRRQQARVQTPDADQHTDRKKIKKRRQNECVVSAWGPWSPCSGGCEGEGRVGEARRERRVLSRGMSRGRGRRARGRARCPALTQTRWCATYTTNCTAATLEANAFNDVVQRW